MAEQVSAQERLDKIVVLIAANMVAEVCSTYVLRVDDTLELYATEGLNREAVAPEPSLTRHEGLVGLVASAGRTRSICRDAQNHPAFSYRPGDRRGDLPFVPRACRSCAPATRSACWWCRTAPSAPMSRKRSRRCRPPPWCSPR
ncbi:MAG: hypothetical protein MZV49_04620 [Rhodopseudomonas palustris]|nr:hypothetical protein [Rhodopseudomonas palustris]